MSDERHTQTLLRRLRGELEPEERRRLEARLAAEPRLRAAAERLERTWSGLELPPTSVPAGFSAAVMERISVAEPEVPAWARLAAAAALVAGIAVGMEIGRLAPEPVLPEGLAATSPTLAEHYLDALAELGEEVDE